MKYVDFQALDRQQQYVMMTAIYLRNAMEDFHVAHLSDAQMAQLNRLIRQALYVVVVLIEDEIHPDDKRRLDSLVEMIPDYWEIPDEPSQGVLEKNHSG